MKKLLGIVVLSLLWCNISLASSYSYFLCEDNDFEPIQISIMRWDDGRSGFVGPWDTNLELKDSIYIFTRDDKEVKILLKFNRKNKNFDAIIEAPNTEPLKLKGKCKKN